MKIFNVVGFKKKIKNKNQSKKQNNQKLETKHVHKQLKELNQGQVSNTHVIESFLTDIAQIFGFVGENP